MTRNGVRNRIGKTGEAYDNKLFAGTRRTGLRFRR